VSLLEQLEDLVIARLTPLLAEGLGGDEDGYLEALEPWQGDDLPRGGDEDLNRILQGRAPAVMITTGDGEYSNESIGFETTRHTVDLLILIVSQNLRSKEAQARGDGFSSDPGLYQLQEDVFDRLEGWQPGVDFIGRLRAVDHSRNLPIDDPRLMRRLRYRTWMDIEPNPPDSGDEDLLTIKGQINNVDDDAADPVIEFDHEVD
jgi:hypothetical protein